jgi:hypothetical protein
MSFYVRLFFPLAKFIAKMCVNSDRDVFALDTFSEVQTNLICVVHPRQCILLGKLSATLKSSFFAAVLYILKKRMFGEPL